MTRAGFVTDAQRAEVFGGLGHNVSEQLEGNASSGLAVDGDVEVHLGIRHGRKFSS